MKNILLVISVLTLFISCSDSSDKKGTLSRVTQPACGSSISSFWTTIYAFQVDNAEGYKFIVDDGTQVRTFETPVSRFNLRDLGAVQPNTTYTIRVDVLLNGSYVEGIKSCNISTTADADKQGNTALDLDAVKTQQ